MQTAKAITRHSPVPLYIQIEEELRGSIESGELGPLAQVPSEAELSESFGVSRMTARKAIDRLVADGMLFRQPGKGTFVAPPKIAHGASQGLSFSAAMRAQGLDCQTRILEAALTKAPSNVARALGLVAGSSVVFLRRLRIVNDIPAAIHLSYLPGRLSTILDGDLTGSLSDLMSSIGARVERSRDTIESVSAATEESQLLGVPAGSHLILIRGTAFSLADEPIRYSEGLYPGDRWQFALNASREADLRPELKPEP